MCQTQTKASYLPIYDIFVQQKVPFSKISDDVIAVFIEAMFALKKNNTFFKKNEGKKQKKFTSLVLQLKRKIRSQIIVAL